MHILGRTSQPDYFYCDLFAMIHLNKQLPTSIRIIAILCLLLFKVHHKCMAQPEVMIIKEYLRDTTWLTAQQIHHIPEVRQFYAANGYHRAWTSKAHIDRRVFLYVLLHNIAKWGLYTSDYNSDAADDNVNLEFNMERSIEQDIRLTDVTIHFYRDLKYGNIPPVIGFNGLNYQPDAEDIVLPLQHALEDNSLDGLADIIAPALPETVNLLNKIRWMQYIICDSNFSEVNIVSKGISNKNTPLVTKLFQLGLISSREETITDSIVSGGIEQAKILFPTIRNDRPNDRLFEQLNVPLHIRLEQLFLSLNYYRWLSVLQINQPVAVVNIPAAVLKVYYKNETILRMRMVVGKPSSPTPTLLSRITDVMLYPYWMVPGPIARKELLPQIKKDPGFLEAGSFQVLDKAGRVINPDTINWHLYNRSHLPYSLRQSTGCDNALGILKLNFYNPYGVYLHDTPDKNLFSRSRRYFSHGCMRMEKPFDLARYILKSNSIAIDTLGDDICVSNHPPVRVPAEEKLAVLVWYNLAGIDALGKIQFYDDVYKRMPSAGGKLTMSELVGN